MLFAVCVQIVCILNISVVRKGGCRDIQLKNVADLYCYMSIIVFSIIVNQIIIIVGWVTLQ